VPFLLLSEFVAALSPFFGNMIGPTLSIADWNTRGLNDQSRKDTVHAFLADTLCHIAYIQETKLDHIDQQTASYIGGFRLRSFAHRPATGTRGGILLLWNDDHVDISNIHIGTHLISANVSIRLCGTSFKLTTVYGPTDHAEKEAFLEEAIAAKPSDDSKWLIIGDFNLIYQAEDKNNGNLNFRLMGLFRKALATCHLKELKTAEQKIHMEQRKRDPNSCALRPGFL
jgi:exonuclease III